MKKMSYFMQMESGGPIKIGASRDPYSRLVSLQTGLPEKLRIIGCCSEPEKDLHLKFMEHRLNGEWFEPHESILKFVQTHTTIPKRPREIDRIVNFKIPSKLSIAIDQEVRRRSIAAGIPLPKSAVIRTLIEEELFRRR